MLDSFSSSKLATALVLPFPEEYWFCSLRFMSSPWERWGLSAEGMLWSGWDMKETGS